METKIRTVIIMLILFSTYPAGAIMWTEGYHQMIPGEEYGEVSIFNDVRLDIYGGQIVYVYAFNNTLTNWYSGTMYYFGALDNSVVNIYGGKALDFIGAIDNSQINLHAYDVIHTTTGGHFGCGQVFGKYYSNNSSFSFDLGNSETYSHINIVPEPSTLILLGLGGLILRGRKI